MIWSSLEAMRSQNNIATKEAAINTQNKQHKLQIARIYKEENLCLFQLKLFELNLKLKPNQRSRASGMQHNKQKHIAKLN